MITSPEFYTRGFLLLQIFMQKGRDSSELCFASIYIIIMEYFRIVFFIIYKIQN